MSTVRQCGYNYYDANYVPSLNYNYYKLLITYRSLHLKYFHYETSIFIQDFELADVVQPQNDAMHTASEFGRQR